MGRIIPICKLAVAALLFSTPVAAAANTDDATSIYAAARLGEIGNRNADALKGYLTLSREAPASAVLADRIFDSAIRAGDMAAALRAVRLQELNGEVSGEAPLLLFADAFTRKNWPIAKLAADELSVRGNLGFMTPILHSWVNVAKGSAADLPEPKPETDPLFTYYSNDQRIYLDLASGNFTKAKLGLRNIASLSGDYVRDLMLRAAPIMTAQGDDAFAGALMVTAAGADRFAFATMPVDKARKGKLSALEGLSALHVRIAAALAEQKVDDQALVLARLAVVYAPKSEPAKLMLATTLAALGLNEQSAAVTSNITKTSVYWPQAVKQQIDRLPPTEAATLAIRASREWPKSISLALLAAQSQTLAGDLVGAADTYREIVGEAVASGAIPQQRAQYQLLLASVLDDAGDWRSARAELDAALILDPNNAQILNYLGYSLLERNEEIERASAMVRKAFEIAPDSTAIMDSMGWAHFRSGEFVEAVTVLERAAKLSGNDAAINEHLGDAYWNSGRLRDARYAWAVASQAAEGDAAKRLASKVDVGMAPR